ncbi:MAG: hypothetical protein KF799_02795 [Bdellovibrionales bacterium]|nr:hypothetical protein [Bdellovibrionales bacterium]
MKYIAILVTSMIAISTSASNWDSVAVFYRPEKVLVQINERGLNSRLQSLMTAWNFDREMKLLSQDESFKIDCARNHEAATCILRFLPSPTVNLQPRQARAELSANELGLSDISDMKIDFLNSNGDHFHLVVEAGRISIHASKR